MQTKASRASRCLLLTCALFLVVSFTVLAAINYPAPTSIFYVNDYARVLDTETRRHIESTAAALERATSAQVVVVTVDGIGDYSLEEYSLGLFREWGIGDAKANNGVLILLDVGGRQTRIEVGYGLEGALPDGKTGRIQDTAMIPHFQTGDYSSGIREGFNYIVNEIYNEYGLSDSFVGEQRLISDVHDSVDTDSLLGSLMVAGFVLAVLVLDFIFTRGRFTYLVFRLLMRSGHSYRGGYYGGGGSRRSGGGGSAGGGGSSRRW